MGLLRNRMTQDLLLRGYAENTIYEYVRCAWHFVAYHHKPAEAMGVPEIRQFLLYRRLEDKVGGSTLKVTVAALRFLYANTLKRPEVAAEIAYPKVTSALPDILSGTEVTTLLGAFEAPMYRAIVMTTYGAGLRISEVCELCVQDIDSQRMLIHVRGAKGGHDRFVPLPERVLFALRRYWATARPPGPQLFPGRQPGRGSPRTPCVTASTPLSPKSDFKSESHPMFCAIRSRPTCSSSAPTCASFRCCSATARSGRLCATPA